MNRGNWRAVRDMWRSGRLFLYDISKLYCWSFLRGGVTGPQPSGTGGASARPRDITY